jgi:hypothetical protein
MNLNDEVIIKREFGPGRIWNTWQIERIHNGNVIIKRFILKSDWEWKKELNQTINSPYPATRKECCSVDRNKYKNCELIKLTKNVKLTELKLSKSADKEIIGMAVLGFASMFN